MPRLLQIDHAGYSSLSDSDECFYIGEYTSRGGFEASETNQRISNLKKKPDCSPYELRYKKLAIMGWGNTLATYLNPESVSTSVTFVPAPCSKPHGHAEYDERMLQVLQQFARHHNGPWDIRPVIYTHAARPAQHEHGRLSIDELRTSMAINAGLTKVPLRETVVVVDDVFTQGRTFKAMQSILMTLPNTKRVAGIFLAKTVWPHADVIFPDFPDISSANTLRLG